MIYFPQLGKFLFESAFLPNNYIKCWTPPEPADEGSALMVQSLPQMKAAPPRNAAGAFWGQFMFKTQHIAFLPSSSTESGWTSGLTCALKAVCMSSETM